MVFGDYPQKVFSEHIDKVVFSKQPLRKDTSELGVPFVATYHPKLKDLGKLIKNLHFFLYSDSEVRRFFSSASIVSYRSARKIKDHIVRSKLYPTERKVGISRCGTPKCQVCASIQVTDTFSSFFTNHNFNCNSKCLLYLLRCKACGKQYTGKTADKLVVDGLDTKQMLEKQLVVT